ncbi:MAG: hypothetical protein ACHQ8D_03220 [Candidatus Rokuibacteriota bacterium]|jgi:hypothetical protein
MTSARGAASAAGAPRGDDPVARRRRRRQLRLRMLGVVAASYLLDALVLLAYAAAGTTSLRVPVGYALAGGLVCAGFLVAFTAGVAEDAPDPFLTLWQALACVTVQTALLAAAPEVGFVFMTVLFVTIAFAALRLTIRLVAVWLGFTAASVTIVIAVLARRPAIPVSTAAERWITCLCLLFTLGRCAVSGLLGSSYRQLLGQRTEALHRLNADLEGLVASRTSELALAKVALESLVAQQSAEITTLHGILPICAHCKQVRDEEGSWTQLEAYVSGHADVQFSHGLCADCRQKHYPEFPRSERR